MITTSITCIEAALTQLGPDELEVLAIVAARLAGGREAYGELAIKGDARDFEKETLEEVADASIYSAVALIRLRRRKG